MFLFSRTIFVDKNDLPDQLDHACSEMVEAMTAHSESEGVFRVVEEMLDCIHSLETACRIAQEKYRLNLADMAVMVVKKNRLRGYYGE